MKQISGVVTLQETLQLMEDGQTAQGVSTEKSLLEAAHDREKELLHEIVELQWRLIRTQEELQKYKTGNAQGQHLISPRVRTNLQVRSMQV
ncbi:SERINE/THREONINE-PROTEIN KINASE OSR1-LIKE ISOFORM X1 [Salix viminalis]|uniref:SERINE/THREONINE-PROTEIN KINASE OSR1-LIKE ISOFORM X1 n=1 Tax=Salix viminalis TaxID=40686 RepID=A0A9Q0T6P5_SALVM|nr:SERINE/THREONINE-PROTEIN KINASE OSR1-LIKE ISOFORM X1 [Salix viminalis]